MGDWFFTGLWRLAALGAVLILPGYAWLSWFPTPEQDPAQRLAEAIGGSLSFTALVALAAFVFNGQFSTASLVALYMVTVGLILAGRHFRRAGLRLTMPHALTLAAFTLLLGWRFYQVRILALPAWVDSVHHTLIVRQVLETAGVPHDLRPYVPVPFYYHFSFHLITAAFAWGARTPPVEAVFIMGQVLNAAIAFSVYRLGMAIWDDRWRAGLAGVLVGLFSQMPAYYASWGRYTLLTGLVLLPLAMAAALEIQRGQAPTHRGLYLAILTAGVLLAHYFTGLLLGLFFILLGLSNLNFSAPRRLASRLLMLMAGATGGAWLALPWLLRVWSYARSSIKLADVASLNQTYFQDYVSYVWQMLGPGRNHALLLLSLLGLGLAFSRPRSRALAVWSGLVGIGMVPWGIRLAPFRPDHMAIVAFLPVCLLVSDLLMTLAEKTGQWRGEKLRHALAITLALALSVWGIQETHSIINPGTILATPADVLAIRWIKDNTSPEARFLINVTFWQGNTYRGVDGGWWILPLTGRQTLLPPVVYNWGDREYTEHINSLAQQAAHLTGCTSDFWELVERAQLTHIYLTAGRGALQPQALAACPGVQLVYQANGISIYRISR